VTRLHFTVPGQPVGKARPRAVAVGGTVRMYTPAKTAAYERLVAHHARAAHDGEQFTGPCMLTLWAVLKRPQRLMRKKDPAGRVPCVAKPDLDNVAKALADGLQLSGVLADDALITVLCASKAYAAKGEEPHAEVWLERVTETTTEGG